MVLPVCIDLLLRVSHVLLGTFSTDPFLKEFGKLHQESGGTYFTTVQQIIKKGAPIQGFFIAIN